MAKVSKGCLSHIVCSNKEAIIIDPFYLLSYYIYLITTQKLKITNVLDTHQHADHISAARELAYVTNSKLCISRYEKYSFDANYIDDRSILNIDKKEISIIHTPGHTIGSLCVIVDMKYIFV